MADIRKGLQSYLREKLGEEKFQRLVQQAKQSKPQRRKETFERKLQEMSQLKANKPEDSFLWGREGYTDYVPTESPLVQQFRAKLLGASAPLYAQQLKRLKEEQEMSPFEQIYGSGTGDFLSQLAGPAASGLGGILGGMATGNPLLGALGGLTAQYGPQMMSGLGQAGGSILSTLSSLLGGQ